MSIIGLDVGTSRVKAVRFDAHWDQADVAGESTAVLAGPGGRREQDMQAVWTAVVRVLDEVVARSPDPIELIAVTAQGDGCWLVDADGAPCGEALLWNDSRAADIVEEWRLDGTLAAAFEISGCMGASGVASSQLRWLTEHEPERLQHAARLLSCASWIFAQLTGEQVVEHSDATNPFGSATSGGYDDRLLDLFGLTASGGLLAPMVSGASAVAPLRSSTWSTVPAGTPIFLAPYDVVSTALGAGTAEVGSAFAVLGTTLGVGVVRDDPALDRPPGGMTLPSGTPDQWLIAYATLTGTEAIDWTARLLGLPDAAAVARLAQESTRDDVPLLLPYLSPAGERSPFLDPSIRGELRGLDLAHTPADIARSVMEGLTLAVLDCLTTSGAPERLTLSGGGSRSKYWCQLVADATRLPVSRPQVDEIGALGAALAGAVALGHFASIPDAAREIVRLGPALEPTPQNAQRLRTRYDEMIAARTGRRRS